MRPSLPFLCALRGISNQADLEWLPNRLRTRCMSSTWKVPSRADASCLDMTSQTRILMNQTV